ncbi:hypothetical protein [Archangium sp. Cb G35]|uniref:hypothetical protein n=1 Tax=Archangium sp. Cb G35 TaxID=1920190 RepID=UPI0011611FC4|nr:hypothetical protein [Archangium sp. Cb G35]
MTPSSPAGGDLGRKILECSRFMRSTFAQIQGLLNAVDSAMDDLGFESAIGAEVKLDDLRRNINAPQAWLQATLGRPYWPRLTNRNSSAPTSELAVIEVHLLPSCDAEHALLVAAHVQFPKPMALHEVKTVYNSGPWMEGTLKGVYPMAAERTLQPGLHPEWFKNEGTLQVAAWPLVSIESELAVRTTVVGKLRKWRDSPEHRGTLGTAHEGEPAEALSKSR